MRSTLKPWRQVVQLRDDVRTGELSLAVFAADLYDVVMRKGERSVYEDPAEFFTLTYPRTTCGNWSRMSPCGWRDEATRRTARSPSTTAAARRIRSSR